ncbi:deaminase, partial [Deinococcus sp.]|uniref:nucleoside deaminase n=1 Tax=Deinococcus sp. TaxID=47478 RepID=UPI0025FD3B78
MTWADLSPGWQAAWAQSWEAYQTGNIPVGAAIVDPAGAVLAVGRNRTREARQVQGVISGHDLAHAEVNALLALPELPHEVTQTLTLLTTVEPCPQCAGTLVMGPVRRLSYAAADPWAGSADLLRDHPYMSLKMEAVSRGPEEVSRAAATL